MDFYSPTLVALKSFRPLVSSGGIIVLDEYGLREFTESSAVDEFFANTGMQLECVPYANSPTAFVRKIG